MRRPLGSKLTMTMAATILALTALLATVPTAVKASAAEGTPADPIYAIISPTTTPACEASGLATLLVPILGGVVGERLQLPEQVDVADLVLTALGPVYIVCGTIPGKVTSRCQLDDQIQGVLPEQLALLEPIPSFEGGVVDSVGAALKAAGLGEVNPLASALKCTVPKKGGATKAPPAPPAPPSSSSALGPQPSADLSLAPAVLSDTNGLLPSLELTPDELPAVSSPQATTLASIVHPRMPGWLKPAQLVLALLLAALIAASWMISVREARRAA